MNIKKELFKLSDKKYLEFNSSLIPTVNKDKMLGVRTPLLRSLAKEIIKTGEDGDFLEELPHKYYEENNLHAFILSEEKDFDRALYLTEKFLPYIDNWATCDSFLPKAFKKNRDRLYPYIEKWLDSEKTYTVRFAILLLMKLYSDEGYDKKYSDRVAAVKSDEYYINMMISWYFAELLSKHPDEALEYLTDGALSSFVHNKAISKACESRKVNNEIKEYIKTLKKKITLG